MKKLTSWKLVLLVLFGITLGGSSQLALAQSDLYGSISGTVTSGDGSPIGGASVIAVHKTKGITRSASTNDEGEYNIKSLPTGAYRVDVSADDYEGATQEDLVVTVGASRVVNAALRQTGGAIEEVVVIGTSVSKINVASTERGIAFTTRELDMLPVNEDLTSVALQAPGNILGDGDIFDGINGSNGRLVSSSGGSVAENVYYLNGFNITDVRYNALISEFPWEAIDSIQVINSGIGAKYGRTTGGATTMSSKTGGNEYKFGLKIDYEPTGLRSHSPDYHGYNNAGDEISNALRNSMNEQTVMETNFYASGPIVKDKAFFYLLLAPHNDETEFARPGDFDTTFVNQESETDRLFINVDWEVLSGHQIGFTYMDSDTQVTQLEYNWSLLNGLNGLTIEGNDVDRGFERGNTLTTFNYAGQITDRLSVKATVGTLESFNDGFYGTTNVARLRDCTGSGCVVLSSVRPQLGTNDFSGTDEREEFRIDFEYQLDNHTISFGYSQEELNSTTIGRWHGPEGVETTTPGGLDVSYQRREEIFYTSAGISRWSDQGGPGAIVIPADSDYLWTRQFDKDVNVDAGGSALYIEDIWEVTDKLTLTLGVRSEEFWNNTNNGDKWIDLKDQIAPRIQATYDLKGDGSQKLYFNFGRYYQPITQRVSERFTAPEIDIRTYRVVTGYDASGEPITGPLLGTQTLGNGQVRPGIIFADAELKPMFVDDISLGYEIVLDGNWLLGFRYNFNEIKRSIEDSQIDGIPTSLGAFGGDNIGDFLVDDTGVIGWCQDTGRDCSNFPAGQVWNGGSARQINPGTDLTIWEDLNGDGQLELFTVPASYFGYPKVKREYTAFEFTFDGDVTDKFHFGGSYTWSKSEGNSEGLVRSDNGQRDPGWTRSFDEAQIVGQPGPLPNDRRHYLKLLGSYNFNENWTGGFSYHISSGRPVSGFGYVPSLYDWGNEYFYLDGEPTKRGQFGRTDYIRTLDLNLNYFTDALGGETTFSIKIFNALDANAVTDVQEGIETGYSWNDTGDPTDYSQGGHGNYDHRWRAPLRYQAARSVLLSVRHDF